MSTRNEKFEKIKLKKEKNASLPDYFTVICVIEVTYIKCLAGRNAANGVLLCVSSQLQVQ